MPDVVDRDPITYGDNKNTSAQLANNDPTSASEGKAQNKAEDRAAQEEHVKGTKNTHDGQGSEYVARKNHAADVSHNH